MPHKAKSRTQVYFTRHLAEIYSACQWKSLHISVRKYDLAYISIFKTDI